MNVRLLLQTHLPFSDLLNFRTFTPTHRFSPFIPILHVVCLFTSVFLSGFDYLQQLRQVLKNRWKNLLFYWQKNPYKNPITFSHIQQRERTKNVENKITHSSRNGGTRKHYTQARVQRRRQVHVERCTAKNITSKKKRPQNNDRENNMRNKMQKNYFIQNFIFKKKTGNKKDITKKLWLLLKIKIYILKQQN